jgi:tRNA(Ile)-lysidine synthase
MWMLAQIRGLAGRTGPLSCCVAWSGGLDSTVLLHLLTRARREAPRQLKLRAVHVNHHLQVASGRFATHCREVAREWRVPLTVLNVKITLPRGASPEEQARDARYAALQRALREDECLVAAQHADDQFETLLLALLRGAGPQGLAGMPGILPFGRGHLLRPLLAFDRQQLAAYAARHSLQWSEDPSNPDVRYDRNLLRAQITPVLRRRWPGLAHTATRSARHSAAAAALEREQARMDQEAARCGTDLEGAILRRFSAARQAAALRFWLGSHCARAPEERRLLAMLRMLDARPDAAPTVQWGDSEVGFVAGLLQYRNRASPPSRGQAEREWKPAGAVPLALAQGSSLTLVPDGQGDVDMEAVPETLIVRWIEAGRSRSPGLGQKRLRKLFQQLGVAARDRVRVPLLYGASTGGQEQLIAVGDLWAAESMRAGSSSRLRGRFVWRQPA